MKFCRLRTDIAALLFAERLPAALLTGCFELARNVLKTAPSIELFGLTMATEEDFGTLDGFTGLLLG